MYESTSKSVRGLGLSSGGLDSILSALIMQKQGVYVEWISFETPFFSSDKSVAASKATNIPLTVKKIYPIYLEMLKNPRQGYGKNMNPCLDCHTLMFELAGKHMTQNGFHFLFSGEVLGQRPMSQGSSALRYVEKHSGYKGYIIRPLSAKFLPASIPELEGLVNRELLCDITGKSRKRQIRLAAELGVTDYPNPAGGCLLTDKVYSKRLKDILTHAQLFSERDCELLKYGRHFRFDDKTKVIIGRNESDNDSILRYVSYEHDLTIEIIGLPCPVILIPYATDQISIIKEAASLGAGYTKANKGDLIQAVVKNKFGTESFDINVSDIINFRRYLI